MTSEMQWRYDRLTWVEMKEQIARDPQPVVAIPFGTVEDHDPHLPLSMDTVVFHSKNIYAKFQVHSRIELILRLGNATGKFETEKPGYSTVDL